MEYNIRKTKTLIVWRGKPACKFGLSRKVMTWLATLLLFVTAQGAWADNTNPNVTIASGPTYGTSAESTSLTLRIWFWNYDGDNAHFSGDVYLTIDGTQTVKLNGMWGTFCTSNEDDVKGKSGSGTYGSQGTITLNGTNVGTAQFKNLQKKQSGGSANNGKYNTIDLVLSFNEQFSFYGHTIGVQGTWKDYCDGGSQGTVSKHLTVTIPGFPRAKSVTLSRSADKLNPVTVSWSSEIYNSSANTSGTWKIFRNGTLIGSTAYGTKTYTDNSIPPTIGSTKYSYTVSYCPPNTTISSTKPAGLYSSSASFTIGIYSLSLADGISVTSGDVVTTSGGVNYYLAGAQLAFAFDESVLADDQSFDHFVVNNLVISGNTFAMPSANTTVTVSRTALWGSLSGADGSAEHPYLISSTAGLDLLATKVNSGKDYSGKYFKLTTNLTYSGTNNYTAIGTSSSNKFYGTFDGGGFTISGINISKASTNYQGLFGYLGEGAVVKDVNLANSVILGYDNSGGIAGYNVGTVSGCTVASTVQVQATNSSAYYHGGIVGFNYGTVSGCTSSAQLTCSSTGKYYGGIVGRNYGGTVSGNFAIGATVPSVTYYGAIVGYKSSGTLSNNYYYNCTVAGVSNATGKGCNGADVTSNNGAVSVHTLSLASGVSTSTSASKTYNGTNYYVKGKTISLSYSGIVPEGCTLTYEVNDVAIEGNTFTMPLINVSVRPALDLPEGLCIDYDCSYTSPEYFYVNMPKKGSLSVTIPKGITAFKVYDYAGRWGKYSYDDSAVGDTYLYLTVPAGNAIEVSGQYAVEEDEHAHIIDMDGTVIRRITGSRWGLYFSLDKTYKSTSQGICVRFDMGDGLYRMGTCEGLDLTMRLVPNVSEVKLAEKYDTPFIVETAAENDESYNVTLLDRTLWRDGDWNTLCLPFEVDLNDKDCPLANATARTLESASLSDDFEHLTLNFGQPVEKLEAGVPYIIRWEASANNIVNPVFKNVKVYSQQHDFISEDNRVHFRGTYDKLTFADEDQNILMLGAQNSLFWPDGKAPSTLGACRAYFELGGLLVNAAQIRSFELNFEGESETAITNLKAESADGIWYTLDGRCVNKPIEKGIYVDSNHKVIRRP